MSRARLLVAAASIVVALAPAGADAWCRTTTSNAMPATPGACITDGVPLYWPRRCQIFSLDSAGGGGLTLAAIGNAVTASFASWNAVTCGSTQVFSVTEGGSVICNIAEYSSTDGNSNTIAFASDFAARMYPTDAIAITVVWHDTNTGQIYDADMIINASMGPFINCPASGCPAGTTHFDLQNVVTHEAGHFLGLAHSADSTATMYYRADPGETLKRTLASDDIAGFCAAYGNGTLPAECDPTPRHGFDSNCTIEPSASKKGCGCDTAGAGRDGAASAILAALAFAITALRRRRSLGS